MKTINMGLGVVGGVIMTLMSGFNNSTPQALIGATWYGWPVTWIRYLLVGPQYNPWVVSYGGLAADLVFWIVLFLLLLYFVEQKK